MSQEVAGPAPCQRKHSTSVNVLASLPNCGRDGLKYEYSYGRSRTKQLRKCRRCLFDQDEPLPRATSMSRGDHSALVRRERATRGRVPHHPRGLSRWSGYSETTRVDKFQTSPLTSRLSETSTGAGLSRHDDVERTSLMLTIVATMRGLDICDVSHHRCASVGFGCHRLK